MRQLLLVTVLLISWQIAAAQSPVVVVKCKDGTEKWLTDRCPPGMSKEGQIELRGLGGADEPSMEAIAAANPVTLYVVPNCDACDLTRNALTSRGIPFTEKNVQDNAEMQTELQSASGGLTVPSLIVGGRVLGGYSRDAIDAALQSAGYPVTSENPAALATTTPVSGSDTGADDDADLESDDEGEQSAAAAAAVDDDEDDEFLVDEDADAIADVDAEEFE